MSFKSLFAIIFAIFLYISPILSKKKKYGILWDKVYPCPGFDNSAINTDNLTFYLASETEIGINGFLEVLQDVENIQLSMNIRVDKQVFGNLVPILTLPMDDLCGEITKDNSSTTVYMTKIIPPIKSCPITKGFYDLKNVKPDTGGVKLDREIAGVYRSQVEVSKSQADGPGTKIVCHIVDLRIEEI